jgi:transcription elongation factor GreA
MTSCHHAASAVVVTHTGDGAVSFGSVVHVRDEGTGRETTYTLVSSAEAASAEGRLSVDSPVARALRGAKAGDVVAVETPRGSRKLRIVSVD